MTLILFLIVIAMLMRVRRGQKQAALEMQQLTAKIDFLRREISRTGTGHEQPQRPPAVAFKPESVPQTPAEAVRAMQPPAAKTVETRRPPVPPPLPPAALGTPSPYTFPNARPTRTPSRLAESVGEILRKLGNWILVGEEHRPKGFKVEYAIAITWTVRIGIVLVVLGLFSFLRMTIDKGILGPSGQVTIIIAVGVAMLIAGVRMVGKRYHLIAQGLIGGGLFALYASAYAMGPHFHLVSIPIAFAVMTLVTCAAGVLSVRLDSLLVAILGLVGGYLTPELLAAGVPSQLVLYSYLLLIGIGVLAVAHRKQWRLLNYLAFVFTYAIFLHALMQAYDRHTDFVLTFSFLSALFVIHSSISTHHNIIRRQVSSTLEIIHLIANALLYALFGYALIVDVYHRPYPALLALGLALFFIGHVFVFLRRKITDRALLITLIALAGTFTTWILPLAMEKESLTVALALLAFMLLWIGRKLHSNFLQQLALILYATVVYRLLAFDMPRNFRGAIADGSSMRLYWEHVSHRLMTFGMAIASIVAAFILYRRQPADAKPAAVAAANDTPELAPTSTLKSVFYWAVIIMTFICLHAELNLMFSYMRPFQLPVLTMLWCALGAFFLWTHLAADHRGAELWAMALVLGIAALKVLFVDIPSWNLTSRGVYNMDYAALEATTRLMDFGALLVVFAITWQLLRRRPSSQLVAPCFGYAGLFLLFVYASLEVNSLLFWKAPEFQDGGMSILWALFAIGFITGGIWKNVQTLRYIGLLLIALVVGKIFIFDLGDMSMIARVLAFTAIGVLLLLGSFAYIFANRKFEKGDDDAPEH